MSTLPALAEEDAARARFYGLLARLFFAPPDARLLAALAAEKQLDVEHESGRAFAQAWRALCAAAAATDAQAATEEYETLFAGTGRAPVSLYAGAYLNESAADNVLIVLRDYLAARGLARKAQVSEPEDHFAALCEVMRHLIAEQRAPLAEQRTFYLRFLWPAAMGMCEAIERVDRAHLYRGIAMFARNYLEIEREAFQT